MLGKSPISLKKKKHVNSIKETYKSNIHQATTWFEQTDVENQTKSMTFV